MFVHLTCGSHCDICGLARPCVVITNATEICKDCLKEAMATLQDYAGQEESVP